MKSALQGLASRGVAFGHDLVMIPLAWLCAYWLRFNLGEIPSPMLEYGFWSLVLILPIQVGVFHLFGLYRGVWRFASLPDLVRILKAVVVGVSLSLLAVFAWTRLEGVPRSVPILYAILLLAFLGGPRLAYRWIKDHRFRLRSGARVLIVGAGRGGEMLVRDMLRRAESAYQPIGFVDDEPTKCGKEIQGVRVLGSCARIPELVADLAIDVITLAVPSANPAGLRRLVDLCERSEVPFRMVPRLDALMAGQVSINQLREVSIEDLLGREPVSLDWAGIEAGLTGKAILVTGAGGSIGAELCRQIARLRPSALILLEHCEYNLYAVERELREQFPEVPCYPYLGDVVDRLAVQRLFAERRPAVVFHAAAYKHVPLLQTQLRAAVRNNVFGTRVVARAADTYGCSDFVLISSDKAVNPANVMGTTKRVAEIYCQNYAQQSRTRFITVRFGNVLGSAGSVVPLFKQQILAGGPVTVTHPQVERYFMTIPEACQLIMQAAVLGQGGEIFVLDMEKPVRISYLADQMIRLSGKVPGRDIEICYTGLRPGEKLQEELFHAGEELGRTANPKILLAQSRQVDWETLNRRLDVLELACGEYDLERIRDGLSWFVSDQGVDEVVPMASARQALAGIS